MTKVLTRLHLYVQNLEIMKKVENIQQIQMTEQLDHIAPGQGDLEENKSHQQDEHDS